MTRPVFKFIDGVPLDIAQAAQIRREVRSHVAKVVKLDGQDEQSQAQVPRRRRRRLCLSWPVQIRHDDRDSVAQARSSRTVSPLTSLSGTDMVPASKSLVYHQPFVSVVLDNCEWCFALCSFHPPQCKIG